MVKIHFYNLRRKFKNSMISIFIIVLTIFSVFTLISIVGNVLYLVMRPLFASGIMSQTALDHVHFAVHIIMETLSLLSIALIISTLLALGSAFLITEYGTSFVIRTIRLFVDVLAGMPGILIGMSVYGIGLIDRGFITWQMIVVALIVFLAPKLAKGFAQIFSGIPLHYREAAYAIGASRIQVIFRILLPMTKRALIASVFLGIARTIGTVAPVMLFGAPIHFLSLDIYHTALAGQLNQAAISAFFLLTIVFVLYSIAAWLDQKIIE